MIIENFCKTASFNNLPINPPLDYVILESYLGMQYHLHEVKLSKGSENFQLTLFFAFTHFLKVLEKLDTKPKITVPSFL